VDRDNPFSTPDDSVGNGTEKQYRLVVDFPDSPGHSVILDVQGKFTEESFGERKYTTDDNRVLSPEQIAKFRADLEKML